MSIFWNLVIILETKYEKCIQVSTNISDIGVVVRGMAFEIVIIKTNLNGKTTENC